MNTKQAVNYLMDNPDKELLLVKSASGYCCRNRGIRLGIKYGIMQWLDDEEDKVFHCIIHNDKREFEVIRKLKVFDFAEAYLMWDTRVDSCDIVNVANGKSLNQRFFDGLTVEELRQGFTIKGHYED